LVLYDNANVNPGILVRQPYADADVGLRKVNALATRLRTIEPTASIEPHVRNVLTGPLEREDWNDGADVVVDATAAVAVRSKLERVRQANPTEATLVTMLIGHTAEHGIATIAFPHHTGAGEDTLRATKLACAKAPRLRGFLKEFWPNPPRSDFFQPEPGCSSPTFQGSGAEVQALAASLLTSVAVELNSSTEEKSAVAHLLTLATADHSGPAAARLAFRPALTMPDASDRFEIRLNDAARKEILAWCASAERRLPPLSETGGLLFGRRDDASGVIWIDEISGPPPDSVEKPEEFLCGTTGVAELADEKRERTGDSVEFLGMWHTHPGQSPAFSGQDLLGMMQLLAETNSPNGSGLILIVGWSATNPVLAAYNFEHDELSRDHARIEVHETRDLPVRSTPRQDVGLALSGGGSRAIAFHLGCLRALNERNVIHRVRVISGVSGGSVIAAMWAYESSGDFSVFEDQVEELLRKGLHAAVARRHLLGRRGMQALGSSLLAGAAARATRLASGSRRLGATKLGEPVPSSLDPPLRRWVSRTVAFEDALKARLFGDRNLTDPRRNNLDVILNACDLRTGSAFRFGSQESGSWRLGTIPENEIKVATAVAASAAYPVFLPALDKSWEFELQNERNRHRVVLTDGGVFDNLGTTCLEPGRNPGISTNVTPVDFIVGCDAGRGLLAPRSPFGWTSQMSRSFESTFRKVQDGSRSRLYAALENGELSGLVMPYLGQRDHTLPVIPPDLVRREAVSELPTNFAPMASETIDLLARRGEQLTRMLIDFHAPEL
jgi:NTE family protein